MKFNYRWYDGRKLACLLRCFQMAKDVEGAVIEVGCWEGKSTYNLANACRPRILHCVDHWEPPLSTTEGAIVAAGYDPYPTFLANMEEGTSGNYEVFKMGWEEYFAQPQVRTTPVAFLHIDGEHTYDAVRENLQVAMPLVSRGGVIAGDDWGTPGVQKAVKEVLGAAEQHEFATWWWIKGD